MPLPNQCQQMTKKGHRQFCWANEETSPEAEEETILGSWFGSVMWPVWKLGLGPTVGPGQSLRRRGHCPLVLGLEKKSAQWLSSEKRPGQELRQYFGPGFGLEIRPTWIQGLKSTVILCQGLRRRNPIIGSWFWPGVEACGRAKVNNKSSLEDKEKYYIALVWDH